MLRADRPAATSRFTWAGTATSQATTNQLGWTFTPPAGVDAYPLYGYGPAKITVAAQPGTTLNTSLVGVLNSNPPGLIGATQGNAIGVPLTCPIPTSAK